MNERYTNVIPIFDTKERMNAGLTREGEDKDLCTNVPVHILLESMYICGTAQKLTYH